MLFRFETSIEIPPGPSRKLVTTKVFAMKNILIPIMLLAGAAAHADSAADSRLRDTASRSSLTRAEVKSEYHAARTAPTLFALSDGPAIQSEPAPRERSRAEVRVDAIKEARAFRTSAQLF